MWISDTAVKRPVLATVFCALLVAFGVIAFDRLPLREYPDIEPAVISVGTSYPGASAAVVENKITEPVEDRIAGVEGIKSITSTSQDGRSNVRVEFRLGRNIDNAANDIRDRVSRIFDDLPEEAEPPEVEKAGDDDTVIYWIHLVEPSMTALELTDYVQRYLEDRFSALDGVSRVRITGEQVYAMRIWLDRDALVARGLTVADVENAVRRENIELPAGTLQSIERDFVIRVERTYQTAADFKELVIRRGADGYLVRLGDVARVELGSAERRSLFRGNGESMVGMGIVKQSTSNALTVANAVSDEVDRINATLPEGMKLVKSYDKSQFVRASVKEVYRTLFIAALLVVFVIFLFLGDPRSVLGTGSHGANLADIHVHAALGAGLQHQPAHAAGAGAVDRPGRGRLYRCAGEYPPTARQGRVPSGCGLQGQPPGRLCRHCHHRRAGCRVRTDHPARGRSR